MSRCAPVLKMYDLVNNWHCPKMRRRGYMLWEIRDGQSKWFNSDSGSWISLNQAWITSYSLTAPILSRISGRWRQYQPVTVSVPSFRRDTHWWLTKGEMVWLMWTSFSCCFPFYALRWYSFSPYVRYTVWNATFYSSLPIASSLFLLLYRWPSVRPWTRSLFLPFYRQSIFCLVSLSSPNNSSWQAQFINLSS